MSPAVSFVIPCYNYGRYVSHAIDSLLGQTFNDLEIIAIDDASVDDTAAVLARFRTEPRVRIIHHSRNQGHIRTYNQGLALARGTYVGCLSADDLAARPDAVERQVALFERYASVGFVYSAHELVDARGQRCSVSQPWASDYVTSGMEEFRRLVWLNYVPASGTLARRTCHDKLGWYDPRMPHVGDWDLWLRIAGAYDVAYISDPLYAYRIHDSNMSHAKITPGQAMDESVFALERNFSQLRPPEASQLLPLLPGVRRHAQFSILWNELALGRKRRSWQALAALVRRSPTSLIRKAFYTSCLRVLTLTLLGRRRYRQLCGGYAI